LDLFRGPINYAARAYFWMKLLNSNSLFHYLSERVDVI
jgi:hypothetical protein